MEHDEEREYLASGGEEQEADPFLGEGMVVVKVRPDMDMTITALHSEAEGLQKYAEARMIAGDKDVVVATNDLSIISTLKKTIEAKRKEYTDPINKHLKTINDFFKLFTAPIEQADKITRQKILTYRVEQEQKRKELEEIAREQERMATRLKELTGEDIKPKPVEIIPAPQEKIFTDMGTLGTTTLRKWEVEDFSLVPDDYKTVDTAKIGKVVRAGIPSIPGVRIFEEKSLRVTAREASNE